MARIYLRFVTKTVVSPTFGNLPLTFIRLMGQVRFKLSNGELSGVYDAIFDTGAPLCVLPPTIWKSIAVDIKVPNASFGGIKRRKECQIRCAVGLVTCVLTDDRGNISRECAMPAFLAKTDPVPLLIGFAGLMENFITHFDYKGNEAWVQEKRKQRV